MQAATPVAPYDGSIPFRCKVQNVGTGVDFPNPDADPFCVEFDKTNQNVTDFGIVDFLLNEPARVAAAVPKCFYHQTDHWTGSIDQGGQPVLWHWDGRYFFDKADIIRFAVGFANRTCQRDDAVMDRSLNPIEDVVSGIHTNGV